MTSVNVKMHLLLSLLLSQKQITSRPRNLFQKKRKERITNKRDRNNTVEFYSIVKEHHTYSE
jgi:hypothetical protein